MAKFNPKGTSSATKSTETVNAEGGVAYKESAKLEFVSTLLTSFLNDKFYESSNETMRRLLTLMTDISDKKFLAKAAIYARTKFGMRSVTHFTAAELARLVKGEEWTKKFFCDVVYRPDDMTEIVSYYLKNYKKPLPNSLKKGLGRAFGKFNSYELAKYRGEGKEVSLVDLVNLIHPKPTEKNGFAIGDLVNKKLKSKDTWETELTQAGQKAKTEEEKVQLKSDVWTKLITEKKIGYFALLRNLRNILEQSPNIVDQACEMLTDEKLIKNSLVLPFRYHVAYKEIENIGVDGAKKVLRAINKAADIALKNVPKFTGKTLIVLDGSGSMDGKPRDIGSLFSAVLLKVNEDADFIAFADEAKYFTIDTSDSVITLADKVAEKSQECGGGTNFHSIFETIKKNYDRIIILSDMQGWMTDSTWMHPGAPTKTFAKYKTNYKADPYVYSFNLNDYGTIMFPEKNVFAIAGWSEKIFDVMKILETDKNALIAEIEKVQL